MIARKTQASFQESSLLWNSGRRSPGSFESGNPAETLANIVQLIQRRF